MVREERRGEAGDELGVFQREREGGTQWEEKEW